MYQMRNSQEVYSGEGLPVNSSLDMTKNSNGVYRIVPIGDYVDQSSFERVSNESKGSKSQMRSAFARKQFAMEAPM